MDKLQMIVLILKFLKIVGPHLMDAADKIRDAWKEFKSGDDASHAKALAKELTTVVDKLAPHMDDLPTLKAMAANASVKGRETEETA